MWFHTDKCYHQQPHRATFLSWHRIYRRRRSHAIPVCTLPTKTPPDLKRRLDGVMVMQGQQYNVGRRIDVAALESTHHCAQPIFVTIRAPGRKALLRRQPEFDVDRRHGTQRKRSAIAAAYSQYHRIKAIIYEHEWRRDDLIMWDNLACTRAVKRRAAPHVTPLPGRGRTLYDPERSTVKYPRRTFLQMAAGSVALTVLPHPAWPLDYPTRPVHLIVGFAAGADGRHCSPDRTTAFRAARSTIRR